MPSNDRDNGRNADAVKNRAAGDADQTEIDKICATLLAIDASLSPIIGARGVNALYQRSLHVTADTHAWLAALRDDEPKALDVSSLKLAFAGQSAADATAAGDALLRNFQQLLTSLIGPSLSERLLRSVWTDTSSGPAAQDTPP